ncbi:MAG TPA: SpoIIE family protein phosphatase [Actinomycetota bacterium]
MRRTGPAFGSRLGGLFLPPDRRRLIAGLAIAVAGPIAITPIVRTDAFATLPGVPYLLVVVAATFFGRLLAAGVATTMSVFFIDRYFTEPVGELGLARQQDVWAIVLFIVVAVVLAQLLARLDRALRTGSVERDRLSFLARAGDVMSGSLDVESTLRGLGDVLVPALADWFSVDLLEGGEIRNAIVVHPDASKLELAKDLQRRFPTDPDSTSGVPNVIRTGRSELTETITDEMLQQLIPDPELLASIRGLGLRSAMTVPLTSRERTFGALTLIGAETHARYGKADLQLAEEIADRAALAIDTARLLSAEVEARRAATREAHRNEILKDATAEFGRATTVDEITNVMLNHGIRLAGAVAGTVGVLNEGGRVDLVGTSGYEPDDHPYWQSFSMDESLPMSDAINERRPIVLSTTAERDRRYPALKGRGEQRDHALVCLPLLLGETAIGGFSASYPPDSTFHDSDLTFLRSIGEQCAQAIARARSQERERATRSRFDELARVSQELARTLDYEETAAMIVRLTVDHLGRHATLCVREQGRPSVLAVVDEAGIRTRGHEAERMEPSPLVVESYDRAFDGEGVHLIQHDEEDAWPGVGLPLTIAGSTSGVLVVERPIRDFGDPDELGFAREAARRMARALDNARLYHERDHASRTLQQGLLPPTLPTIPGLEIEALFLPAFSGYEIGGDFYDVFDAGDGRWVAVIGDVCGKGLEAAAITGLARHTLRATAELERPSEALAALNRALLREHLDGRFCTVAYLAIEPQTDGGARVVLSSGGHPLPQRIALDGRTERLGSYGTLLGVTEEIRVEDVEVRLRRGEALVAFTDGIVRRDEIAADEPTGLMRMLGGAPASSAADIRERIERYVTSLISDEQRDDIAVLVLWAK